MFTARIPVEKTALQILDESETIFRLTGSRLFNPIYAEINESDWDFFTQYDPVCYKNLVDKGFSEILNQNIGYLDSDCLYVLRKDNVDVQFRKNSALYSEVCEYFMQHRRLSTHLMFRIKEGSQSLRKQIWNEFLEAADKGEL